MGKEQDKAGCICIWHYITGSGQLSKATKRNKRYKDWQERNKLYYPEDTIVPIEKLKVIYQKIIRVNKNLAILQDLKINIQKLIAFLYARNKELKSEITTPLSLPRLLYNWDNNTNFMLQEECTVKLKNVIYGQTAWVETLILPVTSHMSELVT